MNKTPLTIVKEYFPELDDEAVDAVLWGLTGWPAFWSDCGDDCDKSKEALERHLRHDLQKVKDKLDKGQGIRAQHREHEDYMDKALAQHNSFRIDVLEKQLQQAVWTLQNFAAGPTKVNPIDLANQTLAAIWRMSEDADHGHKADSIKLCDCECHKEGRSVMHCVPCCDICSKCGVGILVGMKAHVETCVGLKK